ncbi:hypothetical protein TNCV_3200671 [Trichonephila clavipes]|nr:hypothetical protein TNCV_3200671 [Trichonephila clavipes]
MKWQNTYTVCKVNCKALTFVRLDQPKLEQSIQQDHPNDQDPATDVNPAQTPYHDISIQGPYLTLAFPLQALFKCPVSAKPEIGLPVDSPSRGTSRPFIRSRQLTPTSSASYANSPSPRCRHRTLASRRHYSWQNATSNQSGNVASVVSASHQKLGLTTMSSPTRKHLLRRTTSQLKSGPRRAPSVKTGRKKVQKLSKGEPSTTPLAVSPPPSIPRQVITDVLEETTISYRGMQNSLII